MIEGNGQFFARHITHQSARLIFRPKSVAGKNKFPAIPQAGSFN